MSNQPNTPGNPSNQGSQKGQGDQGTQGNKNQGSDLPGTSKDPTGQVITDRPSQKNRQDQDSDGSRSGSREPNSGSQKRS